MRGGQPPGAYPSGPRGGLQLLQEGVTGALGFSSAPLRLIEAPTVCKALSGLDGTPVLGDGNRKLPPVFLTFGFQEKSFGPSIHASIH